MVLTAMMRADPRLANPSLRPEWRWLRVLKMVSRLPTPGRTTKHDDYYIKGARSFMLRWKKGDAERDKLLQEMPGMYHAWMIFDKDPEIQFMVDARLLAGQGYDEVAFAIKTLPEVIEWYEQIFFNVLIFREHHDWIVRHVLLPANDRLMNQESDDNDVDNQFKTQIVVRPHFDYTLKFLSYFGGPVVCDFMISGFKRGLECNTQDDLSEWLNESTMMTLQRRSNQASHVFDINKYNVMELFATHTRIIEIQRSSDSTEERHSVLEKHVHGMLTEIPWTVGKDAREVFDGTVIGESDELAAELNSDELMLIGAGQKLPILGEIPSLNIESRQDLEGKDANAKSK